MDAILSATLQRQKWKRTKECKQWLEVRTQAMRKDENNWGHFAKVERLTEKSITSFKYINTKKNGRSLVFLLVSLFVCLFALFLVCFVWFSSISYLLGQIKTSTTWRKTEIRFTENLTRFPHVETRWNSLEKFWSHQN